MKPGETEVSVSGGALDYDYGFRRRIHAEFPVRVVVQGPSASENLLVLWADRAYEIVRAKAAVKGASSPSVTWNLMRGSDRSAAGKASFDDDVVTTTTTTVQTQAAQGLARLEADEALWLVTTASAGTVDELAVTVYLRAAADL